MSDTTTEGQSSFHRTDGGGFPDSVHPQPPLDLRALEGHTLAPWSYYDQSEEDGPPYGCSIQSDTDKDADWLAQNIDDRSDAKLIAAAPTLLALLREALGIIAEENRGVDFEGWIREADSDFDRQWAMRIRDIFAQVTNWEAKE